MSSTSDINGTIYLFRRFLESTSAFRLHRFSPIWSLFVIAIADVFSLYSSTQLADATFDLLELNWVDLDDLRMFLLAPVFGGLFAINGLYRLRGTNQVEELRLLSLTTTIIYASLTLFYILIVESYYPIAFFGINWLFVIVLFPLSRWIVRGVGSFIGIWGEPVVIIGNGNLSRSIVHFLLKNKYCGMRPVMVINSQVHDPIELAVKDLPIPVIPLEKWRYNSNIGSHMGVNTAIVVTPELPAPISESIARGEHFGFSRIITVAKQFNTRNFGLMPLDFGGVLGLEERHYELNIIEDWQIRLLDLSLIVVSLPILIPLFLCIMLAIKLDSKGSIFYRQTRIGKRVREFKVLKFRTMFSDADIVLEKTLKENPQLQAEWKENHKLKDDPRITRFGKILRKTSLDELPQIWNVLKSEMSLVGPRPIVADEIERYGDRFKYYAQAPPGITGLWQVSGRNDVGYEQRVRLDEYYVRNRSVWMNLYIIIRTVSAVIRRHGAY